jgi:hypothetical protein
MPHRPIWRASTSDCIATSARNEDQTRGAMPSSVAGQAAFASTLSWCRSPHGLRRPTTSRRRGTEHDAARGNSRAVGHRRAWKRRKLREALMADFLPAWACAGRNISPLSSAATRSNSWISVVCSTLVHRQQGRHIPTIFANYPGSLRCDAVVTTPASKRGTKRSPAFRRNRRIHSGRLMTPALTIQASATGTSLMSAR